MANDNIDGHLLAEMILEQLEEAIKGRAKAETKVWSLESDVRRLTDERNTLRADCALAKRELEAMKAQTASLTNTDEEPL